MSNRDLSGTPGVRDGRGEVHFDSTTPCADLGRATRPRYAVAALPPYSYVPGFAPHPVSDPRGHMSGQTHAAAAPLEPAHWRLSDAYLQAADLFNHGYYWEAHEAWESLWHAAGRHGAVATWLKALIKLAAAAVKAREGNPVGVERHARRSLELLAELRRDLTPTQTAYCGLALMRVEQVARTLRDEAASRFAAPQPHLLLNEWLPLGDA